MKTTIKEKCAMSQRNGTHATIYELVRDPAQRNKDQIRDDKKRFPFVQGSTYNGQWQNDKKHGFGTLVYPDGTKYEGDWVADLQHGNGTLWIRSGKKSVKEYVGNWREGNMEGFGTFHYPNGEVYKGDWVQNARHGNGRLEYPNGDYFVGDWEYDVRKGIGIMYFKNGNIFEGMWIDGKKDGMGKFFYASTSKVYEGEWVNDQPRCGEYREPTTNEIHRFGEPSVRREQFSLPAIGLDQPRVVLDIATSEIRLERAMREGQFCSELTPEAVIEGARVFDNLDIHSAGVLTLWALAPVFECLGITLSSANLHDIAQQLELSTFATLSFPEVVDIARCLVNGERMTARAGSDRK